MGAPKTAVHIKSLGTDAKLLGGEDRPRVAARRD